MRFVVHNRDFSRCRLVVAGFVVAGLLTVLLMQPASRGGGARATARLARESRSQSSLVTGLFPILLAAPIDTEAREHLKLAGPLSELTSVASRIGISRGPSWAGIPLYEVPKSVADAVRARRMRVDQTGAVQVYVLLDEVNAKNLQQLQGAGAVLELQDKDRQMVQARVPADRLGDVEALPFVQFVRLPSYGVRHTGSVDTEGDAILRTDQVRSMLHVDGTGVRVGVISDGLKGVFDTRCTTCQGVAGGPISTADLPSSTGTRNASGVLISSSGGITGQSFSANHDLEGLPPPSPPCGFPGAGAEGTALLEIVHDIAPGAQLFFANFDTGMAFKQAVNSLASQADVVVDDIGFFGEPYDGTSDISTNTATALNSSTNPIRGYFTSVGNEADEHYLGAYVDSGIDGSSVVGTSGHLHLFQAAAGTVDVLGLGPQPYDKIELKEGGEVVIFLTWDDPFGSSANDYDLFLVQESTGKVVASSTSKGCEGPQFPVECVDYTNETGVQDFFRIVILNAGNRAAVKTLNLFAYEPECAQSGPLKLAPPRPERHNYNTATSSLSAQSDAGGSPVSVISVGAICSGSDKAVATGKSPSCSNDPEHTQIEFFSSNGPTADGRTKPDVAAIDGVSITGAGNFENPFFGTSAAAPHAAATAALLLQAAPCLRSGAAGGRDNVTARTTLRDLILNNAVPLPSSGAVPNNVFGSGRVDALTSAEKTVPSAGSVPDQTVAGNTASGASVTIPSSAFTDPNQCPLTISATGGCSGSGSSVNCPFGTSTVTVTASNNGVTFSSPVTARITVTNFDVSATPASSTVGAGQAATYKVTVTPQLGAFSSGITLGCSGLPALSTCSFSPANVNPGASRVTSTLTLSTTAASASLPPHLTGWRALPPPVAAAMWVVLLMAMFAVAPTFRSARAGLKPGATSCGRPATDNGLTRGSFSGPRIPSPEPRLWRIAYAASTVLLAFLLLLAACGGSNGGSGPLPNPGTPAGTYNISITGTSGTLVQSASVTLVVQ